MIGVWLAISVFFVPGGFSLPLDYKENYPLENSAKYVDEINLQPKTRLSYIDQTRYWPNATLYYTVDPSYSQEERDVIQSAIDEIEHYTCVRFKLRTNEHKYVKIISVKGEGCKSTVGVSRTQPQDLNLEKKSCFLPTKAKGIVIHELLHALGFFHEHSAHDRDDYLIVYEDNVKKEYLVELEKRPKDEASNFGFGYDYYSVMHYSNYALSADRSKPTLVPKNDPTIPIGQRFGLSIGDVDKLNFVYKCPKKTN